MVTMSRTRSITTIRAEPCRAGIDKLVGARGGGYLRKALNTALPAERDMGSPLYLLIDDMSGTSLVAAWAWTHWQGPDQPRDYQIDAKEWKHREQLVVNMEGICSGFRHGSSALGDVRGELQNYQLVEELAHPQDPAGWHSMPLQQVPAMRRARRIDVWCDGLIQVEAMFQDSATLPKGGRCAIHEYLLHATVDPQHMTLLSLRAEPRILPYRECPSAVENVGRLLGTPMRELRSAVLEQLPRVLGCTHLNDALRALAEVPLLVQHLQPPFSQPT